MSSSFGEKVKIMIFGQSHSEAIGVVIDGLPVGEEIDLEAVRKFMERRAPGRNAYSTPRKEADLPRVVSGLFEGKTCGAPICAVIENTNTRSKDYDKLKDLPRPGHADFTAWVKYKGANDHRGGGHFSGQAGPHRFALRAQSACRFWKEGASISARIFFLSRACRIPPLMRWLWMQIP